MNETPECTASPNGKHSATAGMLNYCEWCSAMMPEVEAAMFVPAKASPPAGAEDLERLVEQFGAENIRVGMFNAWHQSENAKRSSERADALYAQILAAIRALTERAERAETRGNQIAEDYALALNEFNLKDAEVASLREALDAEKAASALAIRLMDKAVILKNEARQELRTLTASHAAAMELLRAIADKVRTFTDQPWKGRGVSMLAAMEQERERAINWVLDNPPDEETGDDYVARALAALRGKGEGE